ncbi:hypothetical protein [Paratractidigestivibacter sp.]|uniref:hypothetical protein n=1 Tax=Paratractidigestivibacter sp. TaxID=2847316 RepID=UPI003AB508C1
MTSHAQKSFAVRAGLTAALALTLAMPGVARATSLSELQASIDESNGAYNTAVAHANELQEQIDANEARLAQIEEELPAKKDAAAKSLRVSYKMQAGSGDLIQLLLSSEDFNEVISTLQYLEKITSHNNAAVEDLAQATDELEQVQSALASQKAQVDSEVQSALASLTEANDARDQYEAQIAAQQAAQVRQAAAQQQAPTQQQAAEQQGASGGDSANKSDSSASQDVETDGEWMCGLASGYDVDNNTGGSATASGSILTSDSVTVAVPASQRYLLGRTVEIRYGGKTITATVTDTGGFASYGRVLDLAGGCWKAFGFSSCYDWGVRAVQYRFL